MSIDAAPELRPLCRIDCEVGALVSLGDAPGGERRVVPLLGGTVSGPALNGRIVEGGADWQWRRADGVLEISAHYVVRAEDGALVEVRSEGLRHGPPELMEALGRGEAVPASAYFFRTFVRFTTGAAAWQHLNRTMAVARGSREARRVLLDLFALG
jgi:Protein of unknown function (DUF3237)